MSDSYKVIDLFAGPGGLAEGFSRYRRNGQAPFEIELSVEKERSAFATLRLRSFTRQFGGALPQEYYDYIARTISLDQLTSNYPREWQAAKSETRQLELGSVAAGLELDPILDSIRSESGGRTILVGGPPCQAYSLVGRARNKGIASYKPGDDQRHFLYREYIRIIDRLSPAAFIMENVKGFLSSKIDGERIFTQVLSDLRGAGGFPDSYRIIPLVLRKGADGSEFLLHAERFGVPQRRHRVILFGVRHDIPIASELSESLLREQVSYPTVADVLMDMPRLRSGLSKREDSPETWRRAASEACLTAAQAARASPGEDLRRVALRLSKLSGEFRLMTDLPPRASTATAGVRSSDLAEWITDPLMKSLPNHEARGHMESDLARYVFAAVFGEIFGRSPKANEFPDGLAPAHVNWSSGKFADRFRVQCWNAPATTITSHISKDGHYFIHPDSMQCRSLTVREAARLQTFPDNYFFEGNRTEQYVQVGNAVPPLLAYQIAGVVCQLLGRV